MKDTSFFWTFGLFLALAALTCVLIDLTDTYILTVNFYAKSGQALSGIPGEELPVYEGLQRWIYFFSVAYLLVKVLLIAVVLGTALFLADRALPFRRVLAIVLQSEFIFLLPAALKAWWFYHFYPDGGLETWHRFYVLSAVSLFPGVPADWIYPLQTLNVFELAYWFLLALGICRATGLGYDRSLRLVLTSYVPALLVWVSSVTFCSLLLFPKTG